MKEDSNFFLFSIIYSLDKAQYIYGDFEWRREKGELNWRSVKKADEYVEDYGFVPYYVLKGFIPYSFHVHMYILSFKSELINTHLTAQANQNLIENFESKRASRIIHRRRSNSRIWLASTFALCTAPA